MSDKVRIHFLGAARTVTGSKYLVEYNNKKLLVDCGLFQGKKELRERNWSPLSIPAYKIDAVVLTHAHLDHTGYLPKIVQQGFKGPIYCTPPTKELTNFIVQDSAHLQEEEARHANKYKTSKHNPAKPLYTSDDAENALRLIKTIDRDKYSDILPGFSVMPKVAGHILGACTLSLNVGDKIISFSGDIGRYDVPLLPDPAPIEIGDLLLCESTYGDRLHDPDSTEEALIKVINSCHKKEGSLLIPSFAVGRTQTLLYMIRKLEDEGRIPVLPVYVDSPMAINATEVYEKYQYDFGENDPKLTGLHDTILETQKTYFIRTVDESKRINEMKGPLIVIAGSGMATGGRILHHLMHRLSDKRTTVLFVGHQAEETRGSRLLNGEKTIKMFGQEIPVNASVETISGLSAHGDKNELTKWLSSCSGTPKKVKIVHGEVETTQIFAEHLRKTFNWDASPAEPGEVLEL